MCIAYNGNDKLKILVEGQWVEQVTQFEYLESNFKWWRLWERVTKQN